MFDYDVYHPSSDATYAHAVWHKLNSMCLLVRCDNDKVVVCAVWAPGL